MQSSKPSVIFPCCRLLLRLPQVLHLLRIYSPPAARHRLHHHWVSLFTFLLLFPPFVLLPGCLCPLCDHPSIVCCKQYAHHPCSSFSSVVPVTHLVCHRSARSPGATAALYAVFSRQAPRFRRRSQSSPNLTHAGRSNLQWGVHGVHRTPPGLASR